ncbi:hypothetical protein DY000_02018152 [Brassica cretica]|uniref:CASP-like protein n=1 Tax=Brassica cretica TaxID=69181 RepID=A0ABQ7D201_BRACR|nr:hypothetical protein DY000_02018152 [Brassica cretica]
MVLRIQLLLQFSSSFVLKVNQTTIYVGLAMECEFDFCDLLVVLSLGFKPTGSPDFLLKLILSDGCSWFYVGPDLGALLATQINGIIIAFSLILACGVMFTSSAYGSEKTLDLCRLCVLRALS